MGYDVKSKFILSATKVLPDVLQHLIDNGSWQAAGKILADVGGGLSVSGYH